jgi:hypothetical protein
VSKEVKPRAFWIDLNRANAVDDDIVFDGPVRSKFSSEYTHVIEYTPEVKRAVECHKDLLEALELAMHLLDEDKNPASTNRIKGTINRSKGQA